QRTLITQRRVALWEKVSGRYTLALIFCTGPVHATSRRTLAAGEIQRLCRNLQPAGAVPDSSRAEMGGAGGYGRNLALSGCGHLELLRAVLAAAVGQAGRCHRRVRDPGRFAEHHRIEILQALPELAESVGVQESGAPARRDAWRSFGGGRQAGGDSLAQPGGSRTRRYRAAAGTLHR